MIESFQGEFAFLSNFFPSPIIVNGIKFPTVEHAYQAFKTLNMEEQIQIASLPTPGQAKRAGSRVELRPDWEEIKIHVMNKLVRFKFASHPNLAKKLQETGRKEIVEGNNWGDQFWGVSGGKGRNELGKILMVIREELNQDMFLIQ